MLLYIIRHGETNFNKEGRLQGHVDNPLNENGISLGQITGEGLADIKFDAVYSSPLIRAMQTADLVTAPSRKKYEYDLSIIEDDRLMEIDAGEWDGKIILPDKIEIDDPNYHKFFQDPEHFPGFPGGEDFDDLIKRTGEFFDELVQKEELKDKTVLVSTHGCAMRALLQKVYKEDLGFWHGKTPNNYAVNIVNIDGNEYDLIAEDRLYYDPSLCVNLYK